MEKRLDFLSLHPVSMKKEFWSNKNIYQYSIIYLKLEECQIYNWKFTSLWKTLCIKIVLGFPFRNIFLKETDVWSQKRFVMETDQCG